MNETFSLWFVSTRRSILIDSVSNVWGVGHIVAVTPPTGNFWLASLLSPIDAFHWNIQWWERSAPGKYELGDTDTTSDDTIICSVACTVGGQHLELAPAMHAKIYRAGKSESSTHLVAQLHKAAGLTTTTQEKYARYWNKYTTFCRNQQHDPMQYSQGVVESFAEHLLLTQRTRRSHSLRPIFAAMNHFYEKKTGVRPFKGDHATRIEKGFSTVTSRQTRLEGGRAPKLRVAVPSEMIQALAESWERLSASQPWISLCFVSLLTGLRPDSLHAARVEFNQHGSMQVTTLRMKNKNTALMPYRKVVPAAPDGHPRAALLRCIASVAWDEWRRPATPQRMASMMSNAMDRFCDNTILVPGTHVTSYSWRKAGASILTARGLPHHVIITWGGWSPSPLSVRTYLRYADHDFNLCPFTTALMDWL